MKPTRQLTSFLSSQKSGTALALLAALQLSHSAQAATTGFQQTGAGPYDYNDAANWVGGTINGIWDSSLTLGANQVVTFGADTVLTTGLSFRNAAEDTVNHNTTVRSDGTADRTLTLGGDIVVSPAGASVTFGSGTASQKLALNLGGATRTVTVASNKTLWFRNQVSGTNATDGINYVLNGSNAIVNCVASHGYTGTTTVNGTASSSTLALFGGATVLGSDFIINNGLLKFDNSGVGGSPTRAKSVTLNGGATLSVVGTNANNNIDRIAGALTAGVGSSTLTLTANSAKNDRLNPASFARNPGAAVLMRGSRLGLDAIGTTVNSSNIVFTTPPALVGSGTTDQTTIGILKGVIGENTTGGTGATGGLTTYDATYGVRLLNSTTEYTPAVVDGQSTLDHVRYVRVSGGPSQNINLTTPVTTIGSLSFNITGAGTNSGLTISGDANTTLKVGTGVIHASQQTTTPDATDAVTLSVPTLDLNGQEGMIFAYTTGVSNGNTIAPLTISSVIANDGGKGVTFGGTGQTILSGSVANTYTGDTILNSGILRVTMSPNIGITTNLVMNGGTFLANNNVFASTANLTLNGGGFYLDTTTSSGNNGRNQTVNHLTMNGGSFVTPGGNGAFLTMLGNATLSGGQIKLNQGGDITVNGGTILNGGQIIARESSSSSSYNGLTTLNALSIVQPAGGSYTPIRLTGFQATNKGAKLILNGDVTFTGSAANSNAVLIDSTDIALPSQGIIALNGTRTFDIGDGAASDDLSIIPALVDGTSPAGLIKTGAGTLALTGANTYTGNTTVGNGTLRLATATLADTSRVDVAGAAVLDLTHGGTDTVDAFYIDGVQKSFGEWGSLASTAANKTARITGTGKLYVTTGAVSSDPFVAWIDSFPSITVPADREKTADPDKDGLTNAVEFALDGNPASGAATGKLRSRIETVGADQALVITLPVRAGAVFDNTPGPASDATIDNLTYTVQGTNNLIAFDQGVTEIAASSSGMPALSGAGWSYRSFRLNGAVGGATPRGPKGFLRVMVAGTP